MNIDEHNLEILATTSGRPRTIGGLAGRLGISRPLVLPAAGRLVDYGTASPSFVQVHGIVTLHGLLPRLTVKSAW